MNKTDNELLYDLFDAYYDARRHKRNTKSQLRFELDLEHNLIALFQEIKNRTYRPSRCMCFISEKPVKREIFASPFRDRIVHHLLFNYISPIFERTFIYDSYSCRKGKGTLFAQNRFVHHIRSCSNNYQEECFVLKLDLKGYFMRIDKTILKTIVCEELQKKRYSLFKKGKRWDEVVDFELVDFLVAKVIERDPTKNAIIIGSKDKWEGLPQSKSLFCSPAGVGLPIGDLTSQLFSNIYLNRLDQYCKRILKCKHYGRYVDDFYIIDKNKDFLKSIIPQIRKMLREELKTTLHPNKISITCSYKGTSFLGGYILPFRTLPGRRVIHNFLHQAYCVRKSTKGPFNADKICDSFNTINSYLGFLGHFASYKLRRKALNRKEMYNYFRFNGNFLKAIYSSHINSCFQTGITA